MSAEQFIDWSSSVSHVFMNPRLPQKWRERVDLTTLPNLPFHIWIASSGTKSGLSFYALNKTAFLVSAVAVNSHLQVEKSDVWLNVLPLFHVGGLGQYARAFLSRSKVVDRSGESWSAEKFHLWVNDAKATLSALVPTQLYDLVQTGRPCPRSLRAVVIGGGALAEELYRSARALRYPILPSYGMTECCSQVATAPLTSLSREDFPVLEVLSHVELRTFNATDLAQEPSMTSLKVQTVNDEKKYLAIKSPALFTGIAACKESDGAIEYLWRAGDWYVTQDQGEVLSLQPDEATPRSPDIQLDGSAELALRRQAVIVHGRARDQIKVSGELVHLAQVRLQFSEGMGEDKGRALFFIGSQPDARRGKELFLAVPEQLIGPAERWVRAYNEVAIPVAKIKCIYTVKEIPMGELGKIKEAELLETLGLST